MNLLKQLIPDEWLAALDSRKSLIEVSSSTSYGKTKQFISIFIPALIGAILGYYILDYIDQNFVSSVMNAAGILAGFVITLMLFTGRVFGTESLDYESAVIYQDKITYLLWSQLTTFFSLLITVGTSILWAIVSNDVGKDSSNFWPYIVNIILISFMTLSALRTFLLPFQIYELHKFSLDQLVKQKRDEVNSSVQSEEIEFDD